MNRLIVKAIKLNNYDKTILMVISEEKKEIIYRYELAGECETLLTYIGIICAISLNEKAELARTIIVHSLNSMAIGWYIDNKPKPKNPLEESVVARCKKYMDTVNKTYHAGLVTRQDSCELDLLIEIEKAKRDLVCAPVDKKIIESVLKHE